MSNNTEAPPLGEQVKNAQLGGALLSFDDIKRAPSDLVEETLDIPEWGGKVRVRSLTAAQGTAVRQRGLQFKGDETKVAWEEMEVLQLTHGILEPNLSEQQVRELRREKSAAGFQRIVDWLDEKSGINKEEVRQAQESFQDGS